MPFSRFSLIEDELLPKRICYIIAEELREEDAVDTLDDLFSYCLQNGALEVLYSFGGCRVDPAFRSFILERYHLQHAADIRLLRKDLNGLFPEGEKDDPLLKMKPITEPMVRMYTDYYNATFIDVPNAITRSCSDIESDRNDPEKELGFFIKDGIPIGIYQIDYSDMPEISAISLLEPFRHKGLGQTCLDLLEKRIVRTGHTDCRLLVASSNGPAVRLYERMGYGFERTLSAWFSMRAPAKDTFPPCRGEEQ